jgi:hypothetical protein
MCSESISAYNGKGLNNKRMAVSTLNETAILLIAGIKLSCF